MFPDTANDTPVNCSRISIDCSVIRWRQVSESAVKTFILKETETVVMESSDHFIDSDL